MKFIFEVKINMLEKVMKLTAGGGASQIHAWLSAPSHHHQAASQVTTDTKMRKERSGKCGCFRGGGVLCDNGDAIPP